MAEARPPAGALAALEPHLPAVADEIIEAIGREVPEYARPLEGAFGKGVRRGVREALARFASEAPGSRRDVYVALGRGEVRAGRTLDALLAAYRVGARVAWRRLAAAGLDAGLAPETLVSLAEAIFAYIDELSAESAEGYAREQAERAGEAERRRAAVIELLLRTPPPPEAAVAEAAEATGWRVPRSLAVVVWPVESGRRPVVRLPLGTLVAQHETLFCAVVPDPEAPGRRAELERALAEIPSGLGTPVAREAAAASFDRAVAALALARDTGGGLVAAADHRVALLLRGDRSLVAEMAADRLAPLQAETPASRARLEETLLAWLRRDGNVPQAAADLSVHAQTVRYRLTRLRELLGDALDDPDRRFELEVVLRAGQPER